MARAQAAVIVPAYNRWDLLQPCLRSVQATAPGVEIVVVDNGSTDETEGGLRAEFSRVCVVRFATNRGFAPACNAGAGVATSDVLVFLNDDTVAHPGWLEPLVEALEDPSIWVAGSLLLYPNGTVQHAGMAVRTTLQWVHLYGGLDPDSEPGIRRAKDLQAVTGACLAMRRADFLSLGGFDETYVNGYEDVDLCVRVRQAGGRIRFEPRSVLTHLAGQTEGRFDKEFLNIRTFYAKWRAHVRFDLDRIVAEDRES